MPSVPGTPICSPRSCSTGLAVWLRSIRSWSDSLMLHTGAERSTELERRSGIIGDLLDDLPFGAGDTLIVASNSGGNAACEELAAAAIAAGASVVAIVSMAHAERSASEGDEVGLLELADEIIDNHGAAGDASITIEGVESPVAPTSTVAGAAIVNAIVAESVEILTQKGIVVDLFTSSNLSGGTAANSELAARYRERVSGVVTARSLAVGASRNRARATRRDRPPGGAHPALGPRDLAVEVICSTDAPACL